MLDKIKEKVLGKEEKEEEPEEALEKHVKEKVEIKQAEQKETEQEEPEEEPEDEEDIGALEDLEEEEEPEEDIPQREKSMNLKEIAECLSIKDPKRFEELYSDDLESWKEMMDNASYSRLKALDEFLGRLEIIGVGEEKETFNRKAYKTAELISRFNNTDKNDREGLIQFKKDAREMNEDAAIVMRSAKDNEEIVTDYLNVLNATRCALEYYEEARDMIMENLQRDNEVLVKKLNLPQVAKVLTEVAEAYEDVGE